MVNDRYDAVIIGAGVIGCAVARELSRYDLSVCVVEREEDVCAGTSKANSAIVHAGHDAIPGTLKARFNVEGSRMMEALAEELDFEYRKNGSLILCLSEDDRPALKELLKRGEQNGVRGLSILTGEQVRVLEPKTADCVVAALYAPEGGIVCPFGLTAALAENAVENGVSFRFLTEVRAIQKRQEGGFLLDTSSGLIKAGCVINAAGVYGDDFHNMVSGKKIHITARKGDYLLLDKEAGDHVRHTIFQLPGKLGKGVLVTPTVHGNLLIGPTATDTGDKEGNRTTEKELSILAQRALKGVERIPLHLVITSFSGLRAHEEGEDFIVGEAHDAPGFFDAAGIESPGLTSAPAIGVYLAALVAERVGAARKEHWNGRRRGLIRPEKMDWEERKRLISQRPEYGAIVCRCEGISEGEILDAIRRSPGAVSLDGLKRRVRQGSGRCQAGFCTPRAMELLAGELGIPVEAVCKNAPGSPMAAGRKSELARGNANENA